MSRSRPEPEDQPEDSRREHAAGARALLRTDLPSAAAVGALMGLVAGQEGSGLAVALVVAFAGCAVVLGLLALKRAFYGP